MNGTLTMDATSGNRPRTGNWATRGAVAAGRGMVLFGLTLASVMLWTVLLTAVALIAWGLFGVVMPAVWHPIVAAHGNNWYAFIHVTTASTAWLSAALGIAFIALGLLTAPWLLRRYAGLARSLRTPA